MKDRFQELELLGVTTDYAALASDLLAQIRATGGARATCDGWRVSFVAESPEHLADWLGMGNDPDCEGDSDPSRLPFILRYLHGQAVGCRFPIRGKRYASGSVVGGSFTFVEDSPEAVR